MGRAQIRTHLLLQLAGIYDQWRQTNAGFRDVEEGITLPVPVKYLRMAHELVIEKREKE